jgi:hypothetical protein
MVLNTITGFKNYHPFTISNIYSIFIHWQGGCAVKKLTMAAFIVCIALILLTVFDFASLHDIKRDYISRSVVGYLDIQTTNELPEWTITPGEWQIVTISLCLRSLFFIMIAVILGYTIRQSFRMNNHVQ